MNEADNLEFDSEAVARMRRLGGDDLVRKVSGLFIETGRLRMTDLRGGVAAADLTAVARAVHSIRGSAGNVGALSVLQCATEIEQAALGARADEMPALVARLEVAMAAAEKHFGGDQPVKP